jgi:NAD(P)-dependent dehydrogenase (short-subunit alcohol dehydrogenase family)
MQLPFNTRNGIALVSGGASGIGRALCAELLRRGCPHVIAADLSRDTLEPVVRHFTDEFGAARTSGVELDVTDETAVKAAIEQAESVHGPIALWCSNAGVNKGVGLGETVAWNQVWQVNVCAHVHAARHIIPRMLERGAGHFLITASAAGLLTDYRSAPYSVSKHAAVGFAEWLAVTHVADPISIHCVCPEAVRTGMTSTSTTEMPNIQILEPAAVASLVLDGIETGRFLILPHPRVEKYEQQRVANREKWFAAVHAAMSRQVPQIST